MGFLNSGGGIRFHREHEIGTVTQFACPAGHADGCNPHFVGGRNCLEDVGRITAGADAPGDVAFFPERLNLFGKNFIEMIIVADAGENGRIGCQGNGCQGRALNLEAVDEFGRQMLSICGAAAVAENKDFIAGCNTGSQHVGRLDEIVDICFDAVAFCLDAGFQNVEDDIFHFAACRSLIS